MNRNRIIHLLISIVIITALFWLYNTLSASRPDSRIRMLESIDDRLRDFLFISRGYKDDSKSISIVTIDEASLKALGQWPWERSKIARLLDNLTSAGALVIGMDVFFPEKDKSSPHRVLQSLKHQGLADYIDKNLQGKIPDFDHIMTNSIARSPVVLGYLFDTQEQRNTDLFPMLNITIAEKNFSNDYLVMAQGVTLNLEMFQDQALSSGFLNNIPDATGMIRRVPLIMKYQEVAFTSLALEIYRLVSGVDKININYADGTGITSLTLHQQDQWSSIPTDNTGRLFLNYLGPKNSFNHISAKDIIANNFDVNQVKDKIILFGATSVGLMDLQATPFDKALPGIEVHATAIENMLSNDYLQHPDYADGVTYVVILLTGLLLAFLYSYMSAFNSLLLMLLTLYINYLFFNYLLFDQKLIFNLLFPFVNIVLVTIASTLTNFFLETKQKKLIRDNFSRKVSAAVVDDILEHRYSDMLIAQEKNISIFFSDIRGFTGISEQLASPGKLINVLNIYMAPMLNSIMKHKGTVDKFIGDAIMAYWNAPHDVNHHADKAVQSAIEQMIQLNSVNQKLLVKYSLQIDIGIGINSGLATVGEMGSKGRSDYTIIGDSVNLASRLEGLNKIYGSHIIISQYTLELLKNDYVIRELDKVRVKGKTQAIKIFEVLAAENEKEKWHEELQAYHAVLKQYQESQFVLAEKGFSALCNQYEQHSLYQLYRQRCQNFIENPPNNFDGVYTHMSK